jgi:uncharacterized membrane protein
MALVTCSECNGSLSTLAASCPHCGAPVSSSVPPAEPVVVKPAAAPAAPSGQTPQAPQAQTSQQVVAKPAAPPPAKAQAPTSVNTIVGLKMAGITLILIGVAIIAYQMFFPSQSQAAAISHNILSGSNSGNTMTIWPSIILFLLGGWLWKSGR